MDATLDGVAKKTRREPAAEEKVAEELVPAGPGAGPFADRAGRNRSPKVTANAFRAGFHRMAHRVLPVPVGSSDRVTRYRHLIAIPFSG
jgi:hypothetical protein